jgi:hypothetical protein
MAQDINKQIEQRIQAFAQELNQLVREAALQAVQDALGGGSRPASRTSGTARAAKAPGGARRTGGRRSSQQMATMMAAVRDFVASNPGARMEQISKGVGRSTVQLRLPVNKLLQEGHLQKRGEKRATEYFVGGGGGGRAKAASKRKTAKRKTAKRKTAKRKTAKRKTAKRGGRRKASR